MRSGRIPRSGLMTVGAALMPLPRPIGIRVLPSLLTVALLASACSGADVAEPPLEPEPTTSTAERPQW